jgi:hypothetical protein
MMHRRATPGTIWDAISGLPGYRFRCGHRLKAVSPLTGLTAGSWDEMVQVMTKHVMEKHPDTTRAMEQMYNEDPRRWGREMKPKWEATREI